MMSERIKWSAALVTAVGVIGSAAWGGTVFALDTRYWRITDQQQYELRELRREAKRYELSCGATDSPQDCAYWEYLKQEIEDLQ